MAFAHKTKAKPKAPVGQGGRFAAMMQKLRGKVGHVDAVKYRGKARFQHMAAMGKH